MRKLLEIFIIVIIFIVMLLFLEAMIPTADGLTIGIMGFLGSIVNAFFLNNWVLSTMLFIIGSTAAFGTLYLSRRNENKLWGIATGIVSIISYIAMFARCSGRS